MDSHRDASRGGQLLLGKTKLGPFAAARQPRFVGRLPRGITGRAVSVRGGKEGPGRAHFAGVGGYERKGPGNSGASRQRRRWRPTISSGLPCNLWPSVKTLVKRFMIRTVFLVPSLAVCRPMVAKITAVTGVFVSWRDVCRRTRPHDGATAYPSPGKGRRPSGAVRRWDALRLASQVDGRACKQTISFKCRRASSRLFCYRRQRLRGLGAKDHGGIFPL